MQRSGIIVEGVSSKWVSEKVFSPYKLREQQCIYERLNKEFKENLILVEIYVGKKVYLGDTLQVGTLGIGKAIHINDRK